MPDDNSTSVQPIRAGIIGLGVGEAHLKSYQSIDGCAVTRICDIDPDRLNEVGDRYGVAGRSREYSEVTTDPDIDVVSICSYDDQHARQLISALDHGKHVMVEKPFVLHKREAEDVLVALQRSGKFITSNLILRQSPRFKAVKTMIEAGDFGEIFHIEGDYLHEILWKITKGWRGQMDFYCTVYGGGIHLIDLMRWLMNDEVDEVCAMGTDILTRQSDYKYPDTITALLQFSSGATGKCTTTLGPKRTKFHSLNVFGTEKTFVNGMPNAQIFTGDDYERDVHSFTTPYPGMEKGDLLPEFVDDIRQGRKPFINEADIFRVMDVCFSIWESLRSRKTLKVDYLI